jgi:methionine-rich copper-binding protein CopC
MANADTKGKGQEGMCPNLLRKRIVMVLIALAVPTSVHAHAALVRSVPGSRAVLTQPPHSLDLCFNEPIELKFSSVTLEDAKGTAVPLGMLQSGADPKCIKVPIQAIGSGVFTVHYRVLSRDGHVVEYGYQFTVKTEAKSP